MHRGVSDGIGRSCASCPRGPLRVRRFFPKSAVGDRGARRWRFAQSASADHRKIAEVHRVVSCGPRRFPCGIVGSFHVTSCCENSTGLISHGYDGRSAHDAHGLPSIVRPHALALFWRVARQGVGEPPWQATTAMSWIGGNCGRFAAGRLCRPRAFSLAGARLRPQTR